MTGDVILEVENDPKEGVVVTVEEGVESVDVPPPCAGCLGEATKRLPVRGVTWLEFPYCDTCVPPRADEAARKERAGAWRLVASLCFGWLGRQVVEDLGGLRGNAVKFLLSESGTIRIAFQSEEYARLFVKSNGAEMPPERDH
ncbi:MAG: hypothetical protein ACYSX0_14635 [Planctomycetota bacterium]|jgi:hypothetical protein